MIALESLHPSTRVDFWLDVPAAQADDMGYLRGERARLLRVVMRQWARRNGVSERDAFVVQYPPEVFAQHGARLAQVRFTFAVGPDLSRCGAALASTIQARMPDRSEAAAGT